jgi:hypothetical protein
MNTHPALGQWAPLRPSTDRASWTEYQRLLTAGVTPATAAVLAAGRPRPDDERAYWRQLARGTPTTPTTRAAHAAAQRQRRTTAPPPTDAPPRRHASLRSGSSLQAGRSTTCG